MLRVLLLLAVFSSLAWANHNQITDKLETKIFCGCTDQAYREALTKSSTTKSSLWNKLKSLLHLDNKDACLEDKTIKCPDPNQVLRVIIASIGTSKKGSCSEEHSTYKSLHSDENEATCHEALRSTEASSDLCDNKNECSFQINKMFSSICSDDIQPKHLNIVFSCTDRKEEALDSVKTLKLRRIKRLNKWEKDRRNRDNFQMAPFVNMPYRWTYDALQPESFRNNRALWGTGMYDYYNDHNYETLVDNEEYFEYLERHDYYDQYYYDQYY